MRTSTILSAGLILADHAWAATSISLSSTRPQDATNVPADFVGFGFASPNFPYYLNAFSENLINSVASRMTVPPILRLGGTNSDTLKVDPNQSEAVKCAGLACPYGIGGTYTVGQGFFDILKNNFTNTRMTFQAPMFHLNVTNALLYVKNAYAAVGSKRTVAIALGNEVGTGPDDYDTPASYIKNATELQKDILAELGLTGSSERIFEVLDLWVSQVTTGKPWTLPQAFEAGLNSNGLVKVVAEHYYQVTSIPGGTLQEQLQSTLMNHSAIVKKFTNYKSNIEYLNGTIPYAITEAASVLGGNFEFDNAFGACLWNVDMQLYAMSNGVTRFHGAERPGPSANHSLWTPASVSGIKPAFPAAVHANYHAQPFLADFINSAAQNISVVNLDLSSESLSAYAAYDGDALSRVALVNLNYWDASQGTARPSKAFTLSGLPSKTSSVTVRTLTSSSGATALGFDVGGSAQNISWAGEQWSFVVDEGKGHQSGTTSTTVKVSGGKVTVMVDDSSAVIVSL